MRDQFAGAMLGMACGDALGAPAEFQSQAQVQAKWGLLTEMVGGGPWKPGEWTDDTGMALCMTEGILEAPQDPVEAVGQRFLTWQATAKDVGATISAALSSYRHSGSWAGASQSTPQAQSGKAAGNGSLMRALPVALAYPDKEAMLRQSARLSAMTHWDPQAEVCCAVLCLWVRELLRGADLRTGWHSSLWQARYMAEKEKPFAPDSPGPAPLPPDFWKRLFKVEQLAYKDLQPSGYAGYSLECLEAAAWCCLYGGTLERTLVLSANLAGEADTIGAVAGAAAGAFYGADALPARWLEKLHERERLEAAASALIALRHRLTYAVSGLSNKPFEFCGVWDRVLAGRNPLTLVDVEALQAAGVTHVLDLRAPEEWEQLDRFGWEAVAAIPRLGMGRASIPFTDAPAHDHDGPTSYALDEACRTLDLWLSDPHAHVFVHCRAGMERTAAVLVACHARQNRLSYAGSLRQLQQNRPVLNPLPPQEKAVRRWLGEV